MKLLHCLASFFILFVFTNAPAQTYNFKNYGLDEGLAQSQVSAFCQDKHGYLWIGTEGGGLNRFDGKDFIAYTMENGLSSNMIWSLLCDSKGELWIGTEKGITHFDGINFTEIKSSLRISDVPIWDITEDKDGNIWFATGGLGVICYNGTTFKRFGINDGLGFAEVFKIYCDKNNDIWAGSAGFGIARYTKGKFANVTQSLMLDAKIVNEISEDKHGKLLVFTESGLKKLSGNKFNRININNISIEDVNTCLFDNDGGMWLSTNSKGLICIDDSDTLQFTEESGLSSNYIVTIFKDHHGSIWTGFDGAGCSVYKGERFVYFDKLSGLPNNVVKCLALDKDNGLWIGTENGIVYFKNKKFIQPEGIQSLNSNNIHSLYIDAANRLWIGTDVGPAVFENNKIIPYNKEEGNKIGAVFCYFENKSEDSFWFGSDDGIYEFQNGKFIPRFQDTIRNQRVYSIRQMNENEIWFCTDIGINIYENKKIKFLSIDDEYGSLDALDAWSDPIGNKWIITGRGLVKIQPDGTKEILKKQHGLSSDNLYLIQYDGSYLWIGSDKGLDRLTFDAEWKIKSIRHYGKSEGFIGVETNFNASVLDENGKIWFGTIKGAICYNPSKDFINEEPPLLKFRSLRLFYEKTDWRVNYPEVGVYRNMPENIVLNYGDNHLTFDFIGFEFINPEKIVYQFYLENFDKDWLPVTKDNFATYSNLPPGDFTFKVRACNSDGYWSQPVSFSFSITAPFWKQTWFYIFLIPFIIVVFYIVLILRTRKLNVAKRNLEEKVRLRTKEISEQKTELEKLSIVASKMNEAVVICNKLGEIEWMNDSFAIMAGYTPEEFKVSPLGQIKELAGISSNPQIPEIIKQFETKKEAYVYDSPHTTKQGSTIWTRGSLVPIYGEKSELNKIIAIYTDITDHQNAENALVKWKNDFTDSIQYAKRIQEAILPPKNSLQLIFNDSFTLHLPRDIVSGDFYWFTQFNGYFIWAVADCTGHGVPGAFMSLIGNEYLHQIVKNEKITGPEQCLHFLDKQITMALHQEGEARESRDGLDIGLVAIKMEGSFCQFAGANIPLMLIRDNEFFIYDGVKDSIGGFFEREKEFFSHEFYLKKGDCLYMSSDGYMDQFGGENGKKFMRKRLKELLLKIHHLPMAEQKIILDTEFALWKGMNKQLDDVLIMGIRL